MPLSKPSELPTVKSSADWLQFWWLQEKRTPPPPPREQTRETCAIMMKMLMLVAAPLLASAVPQPGCDVCSQDKEEVSAVLPPCTSCLEIRGASGHAVVLLER